MKIAQIAPVWKQVPPIKYGGTELIVSSLTEELVKRGHSVTLFASGDSQTKAKLSSVTKKSISSYIFENKAYNKLAVEYDIYNNLMAFLNQNKFDLIHSHSSYIGAAFAAFSNKPVIHTLHTNLKEPEIEIMSKSNNNFICSISDNFQTVNKGIKYCDTVYNGINISKLKFHEINLNNCIISVGKFIPRKGFSEAIKVAINTNKRLRLAGPIVEKNNNIEKWYFDIDYFRIEIAPFVKKNIEIVGEISQTEKSDFMNEKVFLMPISWEEPFGLVMVEAMACGTPVIAFAKGSVPEIVKDGKTGFIVNLSEKDKRGNWIIKKTGIAGLTEAVKRIYSMPENEYRKMRLECRKHVEENFTIEKMVDNYERVYKEVITDWNKKHKI